MTSLHLKTLVLFVVAVSGLVLGLASAAAFNVAGVVLTGSGFSKAVFWEPVEGNITVFFGCMCLLAWGGSVTALIVSSRRATAKSEKRANLIAAVLSASVVAVALIVAVVVLPAQYGWATY